MKWLKQIWRWILALFKTTPTLATDSSTLNSDIKSVGNNNTITNTQNNSSTQNITTFERVSGDVTIINHPQSDSGIKPNIVSCNQNADAIELKLYDGTLARSSTLRDVLPSSLMPLYEKYDGTNMAFQIELARHQTFCRENPKLFIAIRDANFRAYNDYMTNHIRHPKLDPIFTRPLIEFYNATNNKNVQTP